MHNITLIHDLAIVMAISALIMVLCHKLRLPVVLGYIMAGVIIGPYTPPYTLVTDLHSIQTLSELGVVFLLFSIGLEFSLSKLAKVGVVAFIAATLEILLMLCIGYLAGRAFGWNFIDSLFLGAILCISSTTIIAKILLETKKINEKFAQVILGILIIEDLIAIIIIALLSGLAISGTVTWDTAAQALLKVAVFTGALLIAGFLIIPKFLRYLDRQQLSEVMIISVLGLCFAGSLLATKFGLSVALGAFLMGAIIAETEQAKKIIHQIEPIRDMFTAVFFVSVGMLIKPDLLAVYWLPILLITVITIIGKVFSCSFATFLAGYNGETALKVGLGLAQIGEFSFIMAKVGENTQVTSDFLYPIAVSVSAITTLTTPLLMHNTGPIIQRLRKITPDPIITFLGIYTSWLERAGEIRPKAERKSIFMEKLWHYLPRLFLYLTAGLIVIYGVNYFTVHHIHLSDKMYWVVMTVLLFPLLMGLIYTLDRALRNMLSAGLIKPKDGQELTGDFIRTLQNLIRSILIFIVILILVPLTSNFAPSIPLIILFAISGGILGIFLWGSISKLHDKVEDTILAVFDREELKKDAQAKLAHDELAHLIREEYPWEVETTDYLLPFQESGINQKISDLRLRGETGATIVAIYRDAETLANPSPDTKLQPGDVLLLMGSREQIKAAGIFLQKKIKEPALPAVLHEGTPKTQRFSLPAESAHIGKSLKEIHLRRKTGATVLAIQRGGEILQNPEGDYRLETGNVFMLFGWPDEIERAVSYLSQTSTA